MTQHLNQNSNLNLYNPFIPTKRDIQRTNELAAKNTILAGTLTFVFIPAGLFYLNRDINCLKIVGYIFAVSFIFAVLTKANEESKGISNIISVIGAGAITAEQVMAVNKARQRLQEQSPLISADNFVSNDQNASGFETNKEAVQLLKELRQRYETNEISEEEFKMQKQNILKSL
ncbi:SHOCT domain-containing protein [Nostoc sp.]|uniref:SHOCT domain-containing protein n=1 Tax=Nostoc sp. TaxID=1180 RepID=UPI002FF32475